MISTGEKSSRAPTVAITSQGCKINQYEGEELRESLFRRGYRVVGFGDHADVSIINTCTVTNQADFKARNLVRRARRVNPDCKIVVTGCYAQTNPEELEAMHEVDLVVGNRDKLKIADLLDSVLEDRSPGRLVTSWDAVNNFEGVELRHFSGRSRAFVKIQDGCNQFCSFCIIPHARGRSRSRDPRSFRKQVRTLLEAGYREIVLTGIHLGQYGLDLDGEWTLAKLIESVLDDLGDARLRLSSTEVNEVTDELIDLVAGEERICPHFHIPLQCADDDLLAAMRRPYDSGYYRRRIEKIAEKVGRFALGTDVIVGFPGESEDAFLATLGFVEKNPFTYLHVFPYSPREGTPAAALRNQVDPGVRKERSMKLRKLGSEKQVEFARSAIGRKTQVLLESASADREPKGLTEDYIQVLLQGVARESRSLVRCRVTGREGGSLRATPIHRSRSTAF